MYDVLTVENNGCNSLLFCITQIKLLALVKISEEGVNLFGSDTFVRDTINVQLEISKREMHGIDFFFKSICPSS